MSMLERRLNFIIARNPQLINSLNRNKNHPLVNKYSHFPLLWNYALINVCDKYY